MATPVVTASQKWEYKILNIIATLSGDDDDDVAKIADELNGLGEAGWELVTALQGDYNFGFCFKRPKA